MRPLRRLLFALSALVAGLAAWASCAVYDASLLVPAEAGAETGTPPDAGDGGTGCDHASYPPRPDHDDDGGVDAGDIVLAIDHFDFNLDAGAPGTLRGYDLDHTCTCPGAPSCIPPEAGTVCDDPNGRDDSAGVLLINFTTYADVFKTEKLNQNLANGTFNFVIRLRNYNGTANDTSVEAAVFVSDGTNNGDGGIVPASFDGGDSWAIDQGSLLGGVGPPYIPLPNSVDTSAYVTDGVLVASLASAELQFASGAGLGSLHVKLSSAVITGKIVPSGSSYRIDEGTIAGRWPSRDFLTTLEAVRDPITQGALCGTNPTYQAIRKLVCDAQDITASVQNDNTNAPCDALSVAIGYGAGPAKFGGVREGGVPDHPCGPQWVDQCQ